MRKSLALIAVCTFLNFITIPTVSAEPYYELQATLETANLTSITTFHRQTVALVEITSTENTKNANSITTNYYKNTGSAFFIADDLLVTAAHVLEPRAGTTLFAEEIRISSEDAAGQEIYSPAVAFKVVKQDLQLDLALIQLLWQPQFPVAVLEFAAEHPASNSRVTTVGFPKDSRQTNSEIIYLGQTDALMTTSSGTRKLTNSSRFAGSIQPGMSGGPILDADGKVCSINLYYSYDHSYSGGADLNQLRQFTADRSTKQ